MALTLHNLRVLCTVFELGSINLAAERLYLSPSAVSLQIRVLNEHFGPRLFHREGRHLVPTEAGRLAYQHASAILQQVGDAEAALRDLAQGRRGQAVIAGSVTLGSYLLPDLLVSFAQERPAAHVMLQVHPAAEMFERIVRGEVDFGLTLEEQVPEHLAAEWLGNVEAVIVAPPGHPATLGAAARQTLEGQRWVCAPRGTLGRETFDRLLRQAGITRAVGLELGHPEAVKRAVERGTGLAMTYRFVVQRELASGALGEVPLGDLEMRTSLRLVHRPRKYFGPLSAELLRFLRREVPLRLQTPSAVPSGTR